MKFDFATVKVKDMAESLGFYRDFLGFKEIRRFSPAPGAEIVFLRDEGHGTIELIYFPNENSQGQQTGGALSLGITVENMDDVLSKLSKNNIPILRGPVNLPDGGRFVYVLDPNGAEIEFIEGFKI